MSRTANLLGALALRASDLMASVTAEATGRGAQAAAALAAIDREPGGTIERLRHHVGLSQPATVRLVNRLENDGLVTRTAGRDARSTGLVLTPEGQRRVTAVRARRDAVLDQLLAGLKPEERARFEELLERLLESADYPAHDDDHTCRLCDVPTCSAGPDGCPIDRGAAKKPLPKC